MLPYFRQVDPVWISLSVFIDGRNVVEVTGLLC
jgi:hypothetical protein